MLTMPPTPPMDPASPPESPTATRTPVAHPSAPTPTRAPPASVRPLIRSRFGWNPWASVVAVQTPRPRDALAQVLRQVPRRHPRLSPHPRPHREIPDQLDMDEPAAPRLLDQTPSARTGPPRNGHASRGRSVEFRNPQIREPITQPPAAPPGRTGRYRHAPPPGRDTPHRRRSASRNGSDRSPRSTGEPSPWPDAPPPPTPAPAPPAPTNHPSHPTTADPGRGKTRQPHQHPDTTKETSRPPRVRSQPRRLVNDYPTWGSKTGVRFGANTGQP